jgi:hypothetical protein
MSRTSHPNKPYDLGTPASPMKTPQIQVVKVHQWRYFLLGIIATIGSLWLVDYFDAEIPKELSSMPAILDNLDEQFADRETSFIEEAYRYSLDKIYVAYTQDEDEVRVCPNRKYASDLRREMVMTHVHKKLEKDGFTVTVGSWLFKDCRIVKLNFKQSVQ